LEWLLLADRSTAVLTSPFLKARIVIAMKLVPFQRVIIGQGKVHGTVLKRVKGNPVVCDVRLDDGGIKPFLERNLRPEPVTINLATSLYGGRRGKRRKNGKASRTSIKTTRTSTSTGFARIIPGGRVESKR
jgi:hypothetical protein